MLHLPTKILLLLIFFFYSGQVLGQTRALSGTVMDASTHEPLKNASIYNKAENRGTRTDSLGRFEIAVGMAAAGAASSGASAAGGVAAGKIVLVVSMVGYTSKMVSAPVGSLAHRGINDSLVIALTPEAQSMQQVVVTNNRGKYRNRDNPAVELIRKVIAARDLNRPEAFDYATYEEYDKVEISLRDIDPKKLGRRMLKPYRFLFDHPDTLAGDTSRYYPVYLEEKLSQNYQQKKPARSKQVVTAGKKVDYGDLVDTKGVSDYMNTLFSDIDIYSGNIMLFTNQFLSPISNSAPTFYEFFLGDTIVAGGEKLVRLNFIPRNPNDFLFRGMLYVTLDGKYAVEKLNMTISKAINLNFIKNLHIRQDFERTPDGHYYRVSSDASADFSFSAKGKGIHGRKLVAYSHLVTGQPIPDSVFSGRGGDAGAGNGGTGGGANGGEAGALTKPESYWKDRRPEPLAEGETRVYANIDSLRHLKTFIRTKDLINLLVAGYKSANKFEIGPVNTFYSFNTLEGLRLAFGGRSTPALSRRIWLDGYAAYGFADQRWKYDAGVAYSFNKLSDYGYPLHYIKVNFQHDVEIPGQELQFVQNNSFLSSFKRGSTDIWLYNNIFRIDYIHELPSHFSYGFGFKYWDQRPAGTIQYLQPKGAGIDTVTRIATSQFSALVRWAPQEKFYQGRVYRVPFPNQYPIFSLQYMAGFKGVLGSNYTYQDVTLNVFKRFYLSALGYTDATLSGVYVGGKLPFPLLGILPANQTYIYQPDSYNLMNFLEFVSDHYAGVDVEHHFNGFIFNKVPLLKRLKWREILTAKVLYGGVRAENDPAKSAGLIKFPTMNGQTSTFALGSQPYIEAGFGIGNIFKLLRVDAIERFSYLDHPMVPRYGIRAQLKFDY